MNRNTLYRTSRFLRMSGDLESISGSCNPVDSNFECTCRGGSVFSDSQMTGDLSSVCETAYDNCFSSIELADIVGTDCMDRVVLPDIDK